MTVPAPSRLPSDALTSHDVMQGRWRWGWVFSAVWLVYLVDVLNAALTAQGWPARVLGTFAVLGFSATYVLCWADVRRLRRAGRVASWRYRAGVVAALLGWMTLAALTAGERAISMAVFVAVTVMFLLPLRLAAGAVAVLVAAVLGLPRVVPGWTPRDDVAVSVVFASLAMFGIVQMIRRNVELTEAHREIAALAVVNERTRFARDLHDLLGHSLTVLAVKAELAGRLLDGDPVRARAEVTDLERLAREALADVRSAVAGYREVTLVAELASARAALDAAGIEAELPTAAQDVPAERRELFGWAVREGVTNVVRHSRARHCVVRVGRDAVEVVDDGVGPVSAPPVREGAGRGRAAGTASGLAGLAERAGVLGASVAAGRSDDGGFRLRVGW